ncbi:MAG: hypothetical protein HUU22_18185 [Phycisphaerae bacterium]|nr:hypothetical protein [Phycisphaerae bacterium]NUQ47948.1 hypothetical protein [Phycisphaerae bacterium]
MSPAAQEWDRLLELISARVASAGKPLDAIDAVLSAPARTTDVRRLGDHPVMQTFRAELTDGLIRADTARQTIGLLTRLMEQLKP